jgi:preprotein translocase subunit SecF
MHFMTKINYMKYAKSWIIISVVLTLASLVIALTVGFNKGIDFTGGNLYDIQFEQVVTSQQVGDVVQKAIGSEPVIQNAAVTGTQSTGAEFLVRTPELSKDNRDKMVKDLEGLSKFKLISEDQVSATISKELTTKAALAVAVAALLQIIYLWFRFELKFGVTAVVALLHDILITVGAVSLFHIQINSAFVAALLTILGYSINDTVIVFDRIRENLAQKKKGETLLDLTTRSIQETVTRSIYTVLTVLIMLVAMLIWGGGSIRDFAMTLFIGIASGMYSPIFIASALWVLWQKSENDRKKLAPGTKPVRA